MIGALLALILLVRSLVPAVGVFFLGWPADRVVVLFFFDTLFGIGALAVALVVSTTRAKNLAAAIVGTAILLVFLAVPLGMPLVFMLANTDFSIPLTLHDWGFRRSLGMQAAASALWCATLLVQLRSRRPDELGFKPLFGLIFLRWLVVVVLAMSGLPSMLGNLGPYLLVLVYVGAVVFSEINPQRFLSLMPANRR